MAGISLLGRLAADTALLRQRMEILSRQVSSGRRGALYGDIAPDARRAIDLRADIALRATYQGAITRTLGRTQVAQTVIGQIESIANQAMANTLSLPGTDVRRVAIVAQQAQAALVQVAQLLNARQGGEYIFGGSDSANPPIPDAGGISASGMATQIAAAVAGLVPGGAAAVAAATLAAASSDAPGVTPFSAFLSDPLTGLTEARRGMPADDGPRVAFGLFANRNAAVVSAGQTTGSWARDVLRGLATLAALDPAQVTLGQDFQALVATARESLRSGIEAMAQERGLLGAVEQRIEAVRGAHADISITLKLQLSDIEEIDPAQAISALQATQIQLQASYQVIASAGSLSLTQFLR